MRVLSIQQPWASLIVMGHKRIETRSWKSKYRGPVLIHASKGKVRLSDKTVDLVEEMSKIPGWMENYDELPYGKIVGKVDVVGMAETNNTVLKNMKNLLFVSSKVLPDSEAEPKKYLYSLNKKELAFGDYSEDRQLWLLDKPVAFEHHYDVNGRLGLWRLDEPICLKCGCTEMDACIHPEFGNCWWYDDKMNLCSHCVYEVNEMKRVKE